MIEALQYDFMRNALLAALLASALCGILGTLVVVKRYVILAGGIAHAAYGGVGLSLFLGLPPEAGTFAFTGLVSLLMAWITRRSPGRADSVIGVLWAAGMAVGVICTDLAPRSGADLMSYLFGSILTVTRQDLLLMGGLLALCLAVCATRYREILCFAFDEDFARVRGVPTAFYHYALVVVLSLSVVLAIRVVGLILVIALLTIPPSIAERFSRSLSGMMVLSTLLGVALSLSGLQLAYTFNLTAGAAIILVAASAYLLVTVFPRRRS